MLNCFVEKQMYALCILAVLNLRQHVQQNWQINSTSRRSSSQASLNLIKCIESNNVPIGALEVSKDLRNIVKNINKDIDRSNWWNSSSYIELFMKGAKQIIDNISRSITNPKTIANPLSKNIFGSVLFLSNNSPSKYWN
ncbi:uncharacterized protein LOC124430687 [Vespa crabro]|uniref:uncharacterized protein LOC124430687 n=1 Tax=Vespa crabro TaxID=7445 RepID=UPI001F00B250|nr:uncharacterized protein LOC124430687 [Vespa crabro]